MNKSVVINYSAHEIFSDYADRDGYVQFTRSGDRVFIVVDGKPVGSVATTEFDRVRLVLSSDQAK